MTELYLIRHGIAEERGEKWPDDAKRPLTEDGSSRLRKSARALARIGVTVDVIVTPTMPTPAFKLGDKTHDPLQMYLSDIFTISVNLAGVPAVVVPCGVSSKKLPIGLQIIGRPFEEEKILRAAYAYEQATNWQRKRPNLT